MSRVETLFHESCRVFCIRTIKTQKADNCRSLFSDASDMNTTKSNVHFNDGAEPACSSQLCIGTFQYSKQDDVHEQLNKAAEVGVPFGFGLKMAEDSSCSLCLSSKKKYNAGGKAHLLLMELKHHRALRDAKGSWNVAGTKCQFWNLTNVKALQFHS